MTTKGKSLTEEIRPLCKGAQELTWQKSGTNLFVIYRELRVDMPLIKRVRSPMASGGRAMYI